MTQTEVYEIQRQYLKRRLDLDEVIDRFDQAIGGIQSVMYKPGLKLKFLGGDGALYAWRFTGLKSKELARLQTFIEIAYNHAQSSGSRLPGEIHISKGRSSKHYKKGIRRVAA